MIFIDPLFNILISGITNCGKTHFVLDLLEKNYKNKFDYIVIYCPTFLVNKTYDRKFIYNNKNIIIIDINDNLDESLEINMKFFGVYNTLFLIDDCANLHDSKIKESAICKLAFHGRPYGISTWIICQKYNSIVKDFRDNIRMLILFFDKHKDSMELALKQNNIIKKDKQNDIIVKLKNNKRSKLIMQLEHPFDWIIE